MKTFSIQNVDRAVRTKDYDLLKDSGELLVTTIFRTLQGEAPFSGWPAVFLRMSGCNFGDKSPDSACKWCDTFFAFDQGKIHTVDALTEVLSATKAHADDILVITGGEPTLQKNLVPFIQHLVQEDIFGTIQIETNGTQPGWFKDAINHDMQFSRGVDEPGVFVVASPKGIYKAGKIPKPSDAVLEHVGALKFVIEADPSSPHYKVPEWVVEVQSEYGMPVYVSPMAHYKKPYQGEVSSIWDQELIDHDITSKNYGWTAEYAIQHGYRLSVQSHLFTAIP